MPILTTGKIAPAFQMTATNGQTFSLQAALARGRVLLAFFKVSCPTCQYTFPFLERLHQQLAGEGQQIWGVAQDNARHAAEFAKTFGVTFPILIDDAPYPTSRHYGLEHVPSLFLIAPDGRIEITSEAFCKAELLAIQKELASSPLRAPAALFLPTERVPEYKPG